METPSTSTDVYSDELCIYNYCPHPGICKEKGCQHKLFSPGDKLIFREEQDG